MEGGREMRPEVALRVNDAAEEVAECIGHAVGKAIRDLPELQEKEAIEEEMEFIQRVLTSNVWEHRKEGVGEPGEGMTSDFHLRINLPVCPDCGQHDLQVLESEHIETGVLIGGLICKGCLSEHSFQLGWYPPYEGPRNVGR